MSVPYCESKRPELAPDMDVRDARRLLCGYQSRCNREKPGIEDGERDIERKRACKRYTEEQSGPSAADERSRKSDGIMIRSTPDCTRKQRGEGPSHADAPLVDSRRARARGAPTLARPARRAAASPSATAACSRGASCRRSPSRSTPAVHSRPQGRRRMTVARAPSRSLPRQT